MPHGQEHTLNKFQKRFCLDMLETWIKLNADLITSKFRSRQGTPIPWFKFPNFSKLTPTNIGPLHFSPFCMTRDITTFVIQWLALISILNRDWNTFWCLLQTTPKSNFYCIIITFEFSCKIFSLVSNKRIWQDILLLGRAYFERWWGFKSCGSATKADKRSAAAGKPVLQGSQLEVKVRFLVHQLVLIPRRNSHGFVFVLLTQEKKGQALAIPRSRRREEPSSFHCQ